MLDIRAKDAVAVELTCSTASVEAGSNTAEIAWTDPYGVPGSARDTAEFDFTAATTTDGETPR